MNPLYLVISYICLLHLGPLLNLFALVPGGRVFPITTLGHLMMVYLTFRYFKVIRLKGFSRLDIVVFAFLLWSLGSFVLYFQKNNPSDINAYFYGVHLYVMPIFGFFAAKMLSIKQQEKALSFFLWSNFFILAVGLYLWWAKPDFYTVFLRDVVFAGLEDWSDWMIYLRLQSYLSSTTLGVICAITIALAGAVGSSPIKTILVLVAALPSVVLTYQRGGQLGCLFALIYLVGWGRGSRATRLLVLGGGLAVATIMMIFLTQNADVGLEYYINRKDDYNASVWEGRRGYTVGIDYVTAFPLGVGLGGSGNAANDAGLQQWDKVVDANFMRIFADLGVQGFLLFVSMLVMGVHYGIRKRKNAGLSCCMLIFAMICLGTNVLDGHLAPQLFYLMLGMTDVSATEPERARVPATQPKTASPPEVGVPQPASQKAIS